MPRLHITTAFETRNPLRMKVGWVYLADIMPCPYNTFARPAPSHYLQPILPLHNHGLWNPESFAHEGRVGLLYANALCLSGHLHVGNLCDFIRPTPTKTQPVTSVTIEYVRRCVQRLYGYS